MSITSERIREQPFFHVLADDAAEDIEMLEEGVEQLRAENEKLTKQVRSYVALVKSMEETKSILLRNMYTQAEVTAILESEREANKMLTEELNEQARLLGISAEKELALMAKVERLEKELKAINAALDDPRVDLTMTATEIIAEAKKAAENLSLYKSWAEQYGLQIFDDLEEMQKDAKRYRWIRARERRLIYRLNEHMTLDESIDAEMKGK